MSSVASNSKTENILRYYFFKAFSTTHHLPGASLDQFETGSHRVFQKDNTEKKHNYYECITPNIFIFTTVIQTGYYMYSETCLNLVCLDKNYPNGVHYDQTICDFPSFRHLYHEPQWMLEFRKGYKVFGKHILFLSSQQCENSNQTICYPLHLWSIDEKKNHFLW